MSSFKDKGDRLGTVIFYIYNENVIIIFWRKVIKPQAEITHIMLYFVADYLIIRKKNMSVYYSSKRILITPEIT